MSSVFKYLKPYRKKVVLAPMFKMFEAIFELFVPVVISRIIDIGIYNNDKRFIIDQSLILAALASAGLLFAVSAQYFSASAAVGMAKDLRESMFVHIQRFSFSQLDKAGTSTLITRLTNDVNQIQSGVNLTLRLLLRSPFIVFGSMIMAFTLDKGCAMIFVFIIPILSLIVFCVMTYTIPGYKIVQSEIDKISRITRENLSGVRVIRAFCAQDTEIGQFNKSNELLNSVQRKVSRVSSLMNPLTFIVVNTAVIILLKFGAIKVDNGVLSTGTVVALYNYLSQILTELIKLANLIISITKALASAKRVSVILDVVPEDDISDSDEKAFVDPPEIRFENVSFTYPDSSGKALDDISFSIGKGQVIGITGGTGSGKTTLSDLLSAFYYPTQGRILFNGTDITQYDKHKLRRSFGFVQQKASLFKGSIRDNIRMGSNFSDEAILKALQLAQISDFVSSLDEGLDYEIEQDGKNLSGGQKQRLAIARALVRKPAVLVFDDSTSALDAVTDASLRKAVFSMPERPTVFIISQRVSSIISSDMMIVLDDGKIAGIGTNSELLENCDVYKEIYRSQVKEG